MLKYLFVAEFKNGEVRQTQEDLSKINTEKSAFFDVLQTDTEQNPLEVFHLVNTLDERLDTYSVDLRDGSFAANGVKFFIHTPEDNYFNRRLIYFRRKTMVFTIGLDGLGESVIYHLGWQANDKDGNNHQFTIKIS